MVDKKDGNEERRVIRVAALYGAIDLPRGAFVFRSVEIVPF